MNSVNSRAAFDNEKGGEGPKWPPSVAANSRAAFTCEKEGGGPRWPPSVVPVQREKGLGQEFTANGEGSLGETKIILGFWGGYEIVVNSLLDVQVSERDAGG